MCFSCPLEAIDICLLFFSHTFNFHKIHYPPSLLFLSFSFSLFIHSKKKPEQINGEQIAGQPGAHRLRCLFRVTFVPLTAASLAQKDLNSLDYLYLQCCNDVYVERFSPELQPDVALRLAALHIHQHSLANNISPAKLTVKTVE